MDRQGRGFLKKHDVDLRLLYIVGGPVVVQARFANGVQFGISESDPMVHAKFSGADLVYGALNANVADFALVTPMTIKDIQQLRGKRIGIGQWGGGPDHTTCFVLRKNGLAADKDVRIVQLLTGRPERGAARQSGAGESVVINPPLKRQAREMVFNILLDYATVLPHFFSSGFVTTRRYVQQNPQTVQNVVKALLDAIKKNSEEKRNEKWFQNI